MRFKRNFVFGCASAATQIEGAIYQDGKVLSIWDERSNTPGMIKHGDKLDIACDSYHKYKEDIEIIKDLGARAYRFSISWCRIMDDNNNVNPKGIEYYHKVIDECLKNNIEPYITLYHWDLPLRYRAIGGWSNYKVVEDFIKFVEAVVKEYSNKVKRFITINEIQCVLDTMGGTYSTQDNGKIPPYENKKHFAITLHNLLLAHGHAMKIIHKYNALGGFAPCSSVAIPFSRSKEDVEAARMCYFDFNNLDPYSMISCYSDPIILGDYPKRYYEFFKEDERPNITKEDLKIINEPLDFYCQNIYQGHIVKSDGNGGYIDLGFPKNAQRGYMNWNYITPKALYWGPKFLYERYHLPIYISENGFSLADELDDEGKIHDDLRSLFIASYLNNLSDAINDGVDIRGYFYWSLLDNYEWFEGYGPRFGIVYCDYINGNRRIKKDSFFTYQKIIKKRGD